MVVLRRSPLALIASLAVLLAVVVTVVVVAVGGSGGPPTGPRPTVIPTIVAPACDGPGRTVVRPFATGFVSDQQWQDVAPPDHVTYDLTGVASTAYPSSRSPFAVGTATPARNTCLVGGTIRGGADDTETWDVYHSDYNAACVKIVAVGWMQVRGLRCDNLEDGIRPAETAPNANNAEVYVSGTYLTRIRDDCIENDYTLGGLLEDSLWEQCNTGISERPSRHRSWPTPRSEVLMLDHMLIGLYETPHVENGQRVMGENALFKWSDSANRVVIKCSIFKVDSVSLNGTDAMAVPAGTLIDDSACPDRPSTIVWLGGGHYPAPTRGLRVVHDESVWTDAVEAWKAAHGMS